MEAYISLEVESDKRDNGDIEDFNYYLASQIKFSESRKKSYFMRIQNVQIPFTFYSINSSNNVFRVLEDDGAAGDTLLSVTISAGNYTIIELITELETQLDANTNESNAYTLAYDDIINKISFSYTGATSVDVIIDTIANGSTLNSALGFGRLLSTGQSVDGDLTTDVAITFLTTVAQDAPYVVDLDTIPSVIIETDITSNNFYDKDTQKHIGVKVPMNVDRNEKQYYENDGGHLTKLNSKSPIAKIEFRLINPLTNTVISLNGADWSAEVNIFQMTELHKF